jgi:hypothetical protein
MLSLRAGLPRHLSLSSPRMNTWTRCATVASQMVVGTLLRTLVLWISGMVAWTMHLRNDPQHVVAMRVAGLAEEEICRTWMGRMISKLRRPWLRSLGSLAEPTSETQTRAPFRSAARQITACPAEGNRLPGLQRMARGSLSGGLQRIARCSMRDGLPRTADSQIGGQWKRTRGILSGGAQKTLADR